MVSISVNVAGRFGGRMIDSKSPLSFDKAPKLVAILERLNQTYGGQPFTKETLGRFEFVLSVDNDAKGPNDLEDIVVDGSTITIMQAIAGG